MKRSKEDENTFIMNQARDFPIWLGVTDRKTEGLFETLGGLALNYTNWGNVSSGQLIVFDEDYVTMASDGFWYGAYSYESTYMMSQFANVLCVIER